MAEGTVPQRERSATLLCADGSRASTTAPRAFPLTSAKALALTKPRGLLPLVGVGFVVLALALAAILRGAILRSMLPIALVLVAITIFVRTSRKRRAARSRSALVDEAPPRVIEFDGRTFVLVWQKSTDPAPVSSRRLDDGDFAPPLSRANTSGGRLVRAHAALRAASFITERQLIADVGGRFGLTLLSNRRRDRIVAAVTSPAGCFLVGSRLSPDERRANSSFLARATVISSDEVALDAIGPDGEPIELVPSEFRVLVDTLERIDPSCSGRVLLSDPTGAPLQLDGEDLEVRGHHFDLTRPLEWRSILFQEPFGQALTLYQGTWIRQGSDEVVLVSLLPPSVLDPSPLDFEAAGSPELDLAAMRDQRLMQASAGEPPPHEQRVAVDGLFMLPLRVALDQAPRNSQQPTEIRHA